MSKLKNNVVILTGAAGGIGSLLAEKLFIKEKTSLILVDINTDKLEELKIKIMNQANLNKKNDFSNQWIKTFTVDLSSEKEITSFIDKIKNQQIDVLINNAGVVYSGAFEEMDLASFDRVFDVNLKSAVILCRLLIPNLIKNSGHIANVASGAGLLAPGGMTAYASSKFALVGFSEAIRAELRGRVSVSAICPAFVKTDIVKNSLMKDENLSQNEIEQIEQLNSFVRKIGTKTDRVCNLIIKSIKKKKGLVKVGFITHYGFNSKKFAPRLVDFFNALLYKMMKEKGVL